MDKQLRQRADAGGIEKVHTTHIKNQLGCALRRHALKKMTVHSESETERDRRASLARWQFADKSDGRCNAVGSTGTATTNRRKHRYRVVFARTLWRRGIQPLKTNAFS